MADGTGPDPRGERGLDPADAPTEPELPRTLDQWTGHPPPDAGPPAYPPPGYGQPTDGQLAAGQPAYPAPDYGQTAYPPPGYGQPTDGQPAFPPSGYGQPEYPPPGYGSPGYFPSPYGPYAYGAWAPPRTNGLAIASMVCGIAGLVFCQVLCVPGLILGFRARRQIRESQGTETGEPFAVTGLVLSGISALFLVAIVLFYAAIIALAVSTS